MMRLKVVVDSCFTYVIHGAAIGAPKKANARRLMEYGRLAELGIG